MSFRRYALAQDGERIDITTFDDPYPFTSGPPVLVDCAVCCGTGETIEFPADDDERLVECTHCGGTGEAYRT